MRKLFTRYRLIACPLLILFFGLTVEAQGPQISDITDQAILEGQDFTAINLDEVVTDPDNSVEELNWTVSNNVELNVNLDNHIALIETPDADWFGEEVILFTVTDPDLNISSDEAVFTVTSVNDAPSITDIPGQDINEGGLFTGFNLNDYVSDPDDPDASLSWTVNGNDNLLASIDASHNVTVSANNAGWTGSENLLFTVSDAAGAEDEDGAVFTIRNVQAAPVAQNDSYSVDEGNNLSTSAPGVLSNDSDADGDLLSAVLVSSPGSSVNFILNSDGSFTYVHDGSPVTSDSFTYVADDNSSQSNESTVTITINPVNDSPVIAGVPGQTIPEGTDFDPVYLNEYISDEEDDNDLLALSTIGTSELNVEINENTHVATITKPQNKWTGTAAVTFRVTDTQAAIDEETVTFTSTALAEAPVAQPDVYNVNEGATLNVPADGVLDNDTDGDGDPLTADQVTGPANASSFTLNPDGSFTYTHDGSETIADQFTYRAYDGTDYSNTVTVSITINPQNDPPVVSDIPGQTIAEGATFATINLDGYVDDPDHADNQITWTYSGNSLLTVSISPSRVATIGIPSADWNGSETITFIATDASSAFASDPADFTVTAVNNPPVVSDIPNQTIAEGATFAIINLDGYVTDTDNPDNQISWSYSGNSQLTVSISPSRVATITIPNTEWYGVETITFKATDPSLANDSDQAVFTVTSVNDNPVLSGIEGTALSYNEGDAAKPVTGSLLVTDVDNVITSAIIEITSNYQSDQDVLGYTGGGLAFTWNSASGRLTLTGSAAPSDYQAALRQVTYYNSSSSPSTATRSVRFIVNDGSVNSNNQTRNITINSSNSAPVLTDPGPGTIIFTENAGAVQLTGTIVIADDDNNNMASAQVSIASALPEDHLAYTSSGGISGSYSGGTLSLSGNSSIANYRTVLRSVTYNNTSEAPNITSRSISFTISDGTTTSNSIAKTVTITPVNDAAVLDGIEASALSYNEGSSPLPVTASVNITDIDNSTFTSAIVSISSNYQNGQDVLAFTSAFGLTGSWNSTSGELLLTGSATLAQMRSALRSITYENTSKNPVTLTRTVRFQVYDGSNSNIVSRNITLSAANSAPLLTEPIETNVNFTENGGPVRLTNTIVVSDEDNTNLTSARVRITTGFDQGQDVLTFINSPGVTGSYNASTGILDFTGSATLAIYQTVLRNVRYDNTSEAPDIANRIIVFTVNDGSLTSNTVEKTVAITAANDAPVASNLSITALNNNIGTLHTANFTFTDPDGDDPGTHTYQWYRSASSSGASPIPIAGATGATYRPVKADGGSHIGFEVTPVDKGGLAGATVRINPFVYINAAPVAGNVRIYAPQAIPGSTISGRFNYSDKEGNPRGNAIYRWYRSNVNNPTPGTPGTLISSDSTYRLRNTEAGKWIWYRVSPVATAGSTPGDSVWSNIIGPIGAYTANISGSDTFCHGSVMPITLTITGGTAPYQAILTRSGIDTTITGILTSPRIINVRIAGTYTLKSVSDDGGDLADISASTPVVLVVNSKSKARILGSTSICQGVETHAPLTLDFLSGTSPWNVTIRRGETSANDTILTKIGTNPYVFSSRIIGTGPTRHRVVAISDANGCPGDTTSGSAWLKYKTTPVAVISGSDSICPGETPVLTVTLTSGTKPWSFTYQRNGVNAGTYANISNDNQTFVVSQLGTYTLSVVSDPSGTGCGTGQAIITTYTIPTASISGSTTICEHTTANLSVNLTGKSPWKFSYHRNYTLDSTLVENVVSSPRTVQVRKPGTYRLYEVIDRNGCKGTVSGSALITVTPAPVVTISGLKKAYNFKENEIDTIIGTPSGGDYGGPGVLGNFFLPTIAGLGTHNITYRYRTSPGSCYGYDTAVVNVLESNSIIIFENNRTKFCKNDAPFTVTGVNLAENIGTFTISGGAGLVDHGDNTATVYPSVLNPNRYFITYTYYYGGDVFPKTADFDIGPAPLSQFTWATECYHEGQSINFVNNSASSFGFLSDTSYFWNIRNLDNGNNYVYHADSTKDIEYAFPNFGTYEVSLRIVNSYGCADTTVENFNLRPTYNLEERYYESFVLHPISWQSNSETAVNSWSLGNPSKHEIPLRGFSGAYKDTACWFTEITQIPAPEENSWVTSPCFDFTDSDRPMLTMQIWRLFNSNRDGANIQATADSGKTWDLVGELGDGENWFNTSNIRGEPGGKDDGWSNYDGVSNDNNWVRARHGLDFLKGKKDVQFRIAYGSDGTPQNNDGIAFDDFTISERTKMTLIEHFTNTGSNAAEKADSVLDLFAGQYGVHALDIQYHTSNPSDDPFYEDNPMIPTSRQFYYGLSAVPYAVVDGGAINKHQIDYIAGSKPFDKNVIIRQSLSDSKFQISVNASRNGNILNSNVRLVANEQLPLMELSVRAVVVESLIEGISGTNGDTIFRNVVRNMLPDAAGNTLYKSWDLIEDLEIDNSWEIENVNDITRLMVIAFIQNEATREIFNVAVDTVDILDSGDDPLPLPQSNERFTLYPNPASRHAIVQLDNRAEKEITLQLFSNTGTLVYTSRIHRGDGSAILPLDELPDGLYMLRLTTGNSLLGIRKLIITK